MATDLTARDIARLPQGVHRASSNLYVYNKPPGRSWVMIYRSPATGKRAEMGLGPLALVTLAQARAMVLRHRLAILDGNCPLRERRQAKQMRRGQIAPPTFAAVTALYLAAHSDGWKNAKHGRQWLTSLQTHAATLRDLPVAAITTGDVTAALEPIWRARTETASRVRQRIEAVLDFATARGWRAGENPARWRGHLDHLLPRPSKLAKVKHHAALPWAELPALWREMCAIEGLPPLALRLTMLTALRTSEVLLATWDEIDLEGRVWTLPALRMKGGREHRVPLSGAALAVLAEIAKLRRDDWLFPGARIGRPVGNNTMLALMSGRGATVHGTVRSGIRDWMAERGVAREVAEAVMAHANPNKVEAAYLRGDLLEPRRAVMADWAAFLGDTPARG